MPAGPGLAGGPAGGLGEFVAWLRLPPSGRDGRVALLPSADHHCCDDHGQRKLRRLAAFVFHARHGVNLATWSPNSSPSGSRRPGWKPFLYHLSGGEPERRRTIKLKTPRQHPKLVTAAQVQAILDACDRLRDRFLLSVLWDSGVRIGEALGLRHEDLAAAEQELTVVRRVNDNRARAKSPSSRTIPVSASLMRLYADYLHGEYGDLDSDYVFVALWAGQHGRPLTYAAVYDLVLRLRHPDRDRLRPALVSPCLRHQAVARRRIDRSRLRLARTLLDRDHDGRVWPPHRRRRPPCSGGRRLPDRPGGAVVTGRPAASPAPDGSGLLARLMAVVRPEFRIDILVPEPGALIFNAGPCRVAGCLRMPWTRKLCRGHYYRWKQDGCPDMEVFAASACPDLLGRKELTECVVAGCRFGGARRGLCVRHHGFWERAGKPGRPAWLASLAAVADEGRAVCLLSFCTLWRQGNSPFCVGHKSRWEFAGRPGIDEFIVICESKGDDRFDFRPLAGRRQLKLELQYALQCRHDERHVNTTSGTVRRTITLAAASSVTSLLDWPTRRWAAFFDENLNARHDQNGQLAFLRYAHAHIEDLQVGTGWEAEFPRDCGSCGGWG